MIPAGNTIRDSKPLNLTGHNAISLIPSMLGQDEPSEAKMASVTKLLAWKIAIVEESEKLAVIHGSSAS
jgi:hypothetical protein